MAQQPKRSSKRGLGRGLGALIQNTTEEYEEAIADEEVTTDDDSSSDIENTEAQAKVRIAGSRYLEDTKPPRETRRPSDLFFGEPEQHNEQPAKQQRASMPNPILDRERTASSTGEDSQSGLLEEVPVNNISPNPRQPREEFDEETMVELVASVSEVGVLQPIVVRPAGRSKQYELIMGERRWRAAKRAGLDTIPAIVRDTADEDLLREALLENIHRSELNALEEAAAYEQLMNDFGWSQEILSKRVGRSRPHISNTLRLMNLPPAVQRQVASGVLSAGHARAILGLPEETLMSQLAQRVINEGLSVRATEELATLMAKNQAEANRVPAPGRKNSQQFDELASALTDLLDTSVKITLGSKKGRIAIDFASVDDLNRIMGVINPEQ